jgi:hypothetical protein
MQFNLFSFILAIFLGIFLVYMIKEPLVIYKNKQECTTDKCFAESSEEFTNIQ